MGKRWIPIVLLLIMGAATAFIATMAVKDRNTEKQKIETKQPIRIEQGHTGTAQSEHNGPHAVFLSNNEAEGTIEVYLPDAKKNETVGYNGGTRIFNEYGETYTVSQLRPGDVIRYSAKQGMPADEISKADDVWVYEGIRNFSINNVDNYIDIAGVLYKFDSGLVVAGRKGFITTADIGEKDILTAVGYDEVVYSIRVTKGHGTVKFKNYNDFVGGSIEIGYEVFDTIGRDMEYVLREGTYKLLMTSGALAANKYITINPDETITVDLSDYRNEITKSGFVSFAIEPKGATLCIDGVETEYDVPIKLGYGEYLVEVEKDGCEPYSRLLKVEKPILNLKIDLADNGKEEEDESLIPLADAGDVIIGGDIIEDIDDDEGIEVIDDEDEDKDEDEDEDEEDYYYYDPTVKEIEGQQIIINKPTGAEVFFDDNFIGTVPVSITKVTGQHSICFKKSGFVNKTYTVEIENDGEDTIFSFPELLAN